MSVCQTCGKPHVTRFGGPACTGHANVKDDDGRIVGKRPCAKPPMKGQDKCGTHGGSSRQAKAKAAQRVAERKARALLGDAGEPVTDPIGKLCAIAGRAVALMEALAARVDELDATSAVDRVDIVVYGRAIKDAAQVVESIIRMGIAERLAKQDGERTAAWVAFIDGVLVELGHNPRDPQVAGVVLRMLERAV